MAAWSRWLLTLLVLIMLGLLARVTQLKVSPNERLNESLGTTYSSRTQIMPRGELLDRRGRIIATSCIGYRLFVDPQTVRDISTIAVELGRVLRVDPVEIDKKIVQRIDTRYVVINELLEEWQIETVRRADLRGVGLEQRLVREHPHGSLGAGIVGSVGHEHSGLGGFEHLFNASLQAKDGSLTYLRDVRRQPLWIESDGYHPGQSGEPIRLSIDLVVQDIAEQRLQQAVEDCNAGGGRMIVVDVRSGEVLAMCDILRERSGWELPADDPGRKLHPALGRNRCVTDPYEPGSTFKPFVWAVATELGYAHPQEVLKTPTAEDGPYRTEYGRSIRDSHYYGPVTWERVLVKSLNSGMAMVAARMSHKEMQQVIRDFGFGARTNCGLPGESAGIVTPPKQWRNYTQSSVSFGHEISITMLQMARAFCVFARPDGTMPVLRITAETLQEETIPLVQRVLSPETVMTTRQAMRKVMTEGTGRASQSRKYQMFAKSGTPQLPKKKGGGYYEDRYVPSFIAGAPFDSPRIVVLCVIDDPDRKINHWGGVVAGPAVRDVIDETLSYLGVLPDITDDLEELAVTE